MAVVYVSRNCYKDYVSLVNEIDNIDPNLLLKSDFYFEGIFTNSGVLEGSSFFQELIKRLEYKVIPRVYHDKDIRRFIFVPKVRKILKAKKYSKLDIQEVFQSIYNLNSKAENIVSKKILAALELNLLRIKYHMNSVSFHMKNLCYPEEILNFKKIEESFSNYKKSQSIQNFKALKGTLLEHLDELHKSKYIQNSGISFDLSYRYLISEDLIKRFIKLLSLNYYLKSLHFSDELYDLFEILKTDITKSRSVFSLLSSYWSIINYEATEYSARLGRKYSQSSLEGIFSIFTSSLIGGCLVGLFAFLKPFLSLELVNFSFLQYLSHGFLYSFIFLCIYFLKGTLATKQPSKIICSILNILDKQEESDQSFSEIASLLRMSILNQFFSVVGNVIAGAGFSYLIFLIFEKNNYYPLTNEILISEFNGLHIFDSRSLYYACVAGVWLVLSGIAGGLVDNWYREKNFHLAEKRDFSLFRKKIFKFLSNHIGQIASSTFLGFALAFSPYIGNAIGIDLSIRHVTFASTQIPYFLYSTSEFNLNILLPIITGVFGIGLFNVLVGYGLTFFMLFKSRKMKSNYLKKLFFKLLYK